MINDGINSGNFALKEQFDDGFLPYWGLSQTDLYSNGKIHVDHYHSGFEIRLLISIYNEINDKIWKNAYIKYYNWYSKNLFSNNTKRGCEWPEGHPDESDFKFCGKERFEDKPYCLEHCAIAYVIPEKEEGEKEQIANPAR